MVVDDLLWLQSDHMDEIHLDEDIPECYVKYIVGIFSVDIFKSSRDNTPRKPMINNLMKEQQKDTTCQILMNQLVNNDRPYLLDDNTVLSRRSGLYGAVQHYKPMSLRQSILLLCS